MTELDAIQKLFVCNPLVKRYINGSEKLSLSETEKRALIGFSKIKKAGFSYEKLKLLGLRAGLSPADLGILNWLYLQVQQEIRLFDSRIENV